VETGRLSTLKIPESVGESVGTGKADRAQTSPETDLLKFPADHLHHYIVA